jgi:hypothetical protein
MALNLSVYRDLKRDYQGGVPFVSQCFLKEMDELYNMVLDILSWLHTCIDNSSMAMRQENSFKSGVHKA